VKKRIRKIQGRIRVGALLLLGIIVLRGPFPLLMRLLPRFFDYIFFVYPGKESDIGGYLPYFLANSAWCRTQIFFGGIITAPPGKKAGRGFLIGSPSTVRSMLRSEVECRILEKKMKKIADCFSVKGIAIAGRAPSIFMHHGIVLEDPFVQGEKGMVFCTIETLYFVAQKHQISLQTANIAVFGAGRVGKSIAEFLSAEGYNVTNIRAQSVFDPEGRKLSNDVNDILRVADIVIVISAKGSDFHPHMKYLRDGAIIIGETHPPIQRPFEKGSIYRAGLSLEGLRFVPALETYSATSIPGCVVEAIVFARYGEIADQKTFNKMARAIGFCACNVV
jgi:hypothetical protein